MRRVTVAAAFLLLAAWVPGHAAAQDLQLGLWSGTLTPPGGNEAVPIMLEVRDVQGTLEITMSNPDRGPMEFTDEALDGDELTFWFSPGVRVDCALLRQDDGSFEGPCDDGRVAGVVGVLTMRPPGA